jgi:ABC-2 type transport system ATP-binding protein
MIEAHGLSKIFDGFKAVDGIELSVGEGSLFAFLGPNGAGKTTTIRMLTSVLRPSSGWARVAGHDIVKHAARVRANVGVLTEQHGLYERMRALEYLDFFGRIYQLDANTRKKQSLALMERFGLIDALDKRVGEYSKGMKQKLALVRSMLHNPPVLLLDEPTSAMDPQSAKQVRDAVEELKQDKRTIILTTHNLTEAQQLADRIGVIRHGRLIANGTLKELSKRFVGDPTMEVRFAEPAPNAADLIQDLVNIETTTESSIQYRTAVPQQINPTVLSRLMANNMKVVTLAELPRTLENVYLQIVAEDEGAAQEGGAARPNTNIKRGA